MTALLEKLKIYILQQLSIEGLTILKKVFIAIAVFLVIYILIQRVIDYVKIKIEENHLGNNNDIQKVSKLLTSIIFVVLSFFNFLVFLQLLGLDVAILMGGISMGLAYSMENIISNLIAGFFIVTNKKFSIGDMITIEGNINITGFVEDITLRYTVVKTFDRRKTIIPNTEFSKSPFRTIKTEKFIRGEILIHAPRHVDIKQVKQLIISTINNNNSTIQPDYSSVIISGFDEKGIIFKGFFLVDPADAGVGFLTKVALNQELYTAFTQYGIAVPYFHINIDT